MPYIDKLAWIQIKDRQVLGARSKGKQIYYIPGGKRNIDETDEEALSREVLEELSVRLVPSTLSFVAQFEAQAHGKPEGTMVKTTCYKADYEGTLQANSEIEELRWLTHSDKHRCSPVNTIILDWLKEEDLIE